MHKIIREPYRTSPSDSLKEYVQRYELDPHNEVNIGHLHFYRILQASRVDISALQFSTFILVHTDFHLKVGVSLVDEAGHQYFVRAREHFCCFDPDLLPYQLKTASYLLEGDAEVIGEYLAISE
ncbi:MAG: hypothetical protein IJ343_09860 [Clostridia bacterium]|nr:hypothetical protein [Clostridia bacterium]